MNFEDYLNAQLVKKQDKIAALYQRLADTPTSLGPNALIIMSTIYLDQVNSDIAEVQAEIDEILSYLAGAQESGIDLKTINTADPAILQRNDLQSGVLQSGAEQPVNP